MAKRIVAYALSIIGLIGNNFYNTIKSDDVSIIQTQEQPYMHMEEKITTQKSNDTQNLTMEQTKNTININTASYRELQELYRVGPKTAEKIIRYREDVKPFEKASDIMKVKGIGPKTYEKIKDSIAVK